MSWGNSVTRSGYTPALLFGYCPVMRCPLPLVAAATLVFVLSAITAGCGGGSQLNDKPGLVTSWGKDGVAKLPGFEVKQTIEDRSGRVVAVGNYKGNFAQVVRLLPNGSLDSSFGKDGIVRWPLHMFQDRFPSGMDYLGWDGAALLPDGRIVLSGTNIVGIVDVKSTLVVSEIDESGKVVSSFGDNGYFLADKRLYDCPAASIGKNCQSIFFALARKKTTCTRGPVGLAIQGGKIVVATYRFCSPGESRHVVVLRLSPTGVLDRSFGKRGEVTLPATHPPIIVGAPLLAFPDGRLVVADMTPKGGMVRLTGLLRNGALNPHFGKGGVATTRASIDTDGLNGITALMSNRQGRLSLTGSNYNGPFLVRFDSSGRPLNFWFGSPWTPTIVGLGESNYENFGGAFGASPSIAGFPSAFAQLKNGELVGAAALLARITPDGVIDPFYPPQQLYGAGKLRIGGLLAASDGAVLVTLHKYHPEPGTYTAYLARYR